jgi:hypothetical protein
MLRSVTIAAAAITAAVCLVPTVPANAARTPPAGSYQQSCAQVSLSNGGILSAQCQSRGGRYAPASLNIADCGPGDIQNLDGHLSCQPAYGPGRRAEGPGRGPAAGSGAGPSGGRGRGPGRRDYGPASLTLYEAAGFQGRSVEIRGDIDSLDYEKFNDTTSSIRVNGGEWQICAAAQYRGNCVVIRKDVPNMNRYKMNDQLSSVRRIG